ncbi:MAG: zinc-binding dehydrogenase [Gemmatimonadota bacterium]
MKIAAMLGEGRAGLVERPRPKGGGPFAVVEVRTVPMCTEYKAFRDGHRGEGFGHEAAGEVVEAPGSGRVRPGDRVVVMPISPCGRCALCLQGEYIHCQNLVDPLAATGSETGTATYAQYLLKQDWLLVPIPAGMSYEHAAMACCGLGPTFGAMQRLQVGAFDTVLITGMGPVGLGGVINATCRGARVIAVEGHPYRARLAADLGAEVVLDPADPAILEAILELTEGRGVDRAVDCSGAAPAHRLMVDALRRRGAGAFVGEGGEFPLAASRDMIRKGLALHGVWHYNLGDTPAILEVIAAATAQLDRLITHRFPMSRVQEAWELQVTGACGKVMLDPWT